MKHFLTSLVVLVSCAAAQAEIVFDNFSTSTSLAPTPLDDNRAGTRTITTTGTASIVLDGAGGVNMAGGASAGSRINLTYDFTTPVNMQDPTLQFATFNVDLFDAIVGTWTLQAIFTNSALANASLGPFVVTAPGIRSFNHTNLATLFATDVKSVTFRLTSQSAGATIASSDSKITANPEPASLALLGMTGLGGWFMARRRAKKTEVVI